MYISHQADGWQRLCGRCFSLKACNFHRLGAECYMHAKLNGDLSFSARNSCFISRYRLSQRPVSPPPVWHIYRICAFFAVTEPKWWQTWLWIVCKLKRLMTSRLTNTVPLRKMSIFYSISTTFGRCGQADYACAWAVLEAMAMHLQKWTAPVSANYRGPWHSGGMAAYQNDLLTSECTGIKTQGEFLIFFFCMIGNF